MSIQSLIGVETVRLLAHVALLASWEGSNSAAERILAALQLARPKEPNICVCIAMVLASQSRHEEAIVLLEEVRATHPEHAGAKGLLGYVKFTMGERGWQELLEEVIADGSDKNSVELAKQVLSENQELHTSPSSSEVFESHSIPYA